MRKLKNRKGMTLAEVLMVVAIIVILTGVSFIAVQRYQRSLGQVERDGIAKEIFVAAQNHLAAAYGAGYPGITKFGTSDPEGKEIYYLINGRDDDEAMLDLMLPLGSIDEFVRTGGNYIIRYQKSTGLVLDVFYSSKSASVSDFNYVYKDISPGIYSQILALRDTGTDPESGSKKLQRRDWSSHIVGWFGGADAVLLPTSPTLKVPTIKVINEEKLYVEVTDENFNRTELQTIEYGIRLIVKGVSSKAEKVFVLKETGYSIDLDHVRPILSGGKSTYNIILDDVTTSGLHFGNISADKGTFIPGEDIEVQAVTYSTSALSNVAYSAKVSDNTLFGTVSSSGKAYINNFRHFENLDKNISKLAATVTTAEQTDDFDWYVFRTNIRALETAREGYTLGDPTTVKVFDSSTGVTKNGCYMPVDLTYSLDYEGKNHSIKNLLVKDVMNAGLFGKISAPDPVNIKDLELIDFSISSNTASSSTAGALAGKIENGIVSNILARHTDRTITSEETLRVSGPTAGGLIGNMAGGTLKYSGAALIVEGVTTAGGLVGDAGCSINACFSGGHTTSTQYSTTDYNVTAITAGGLVGSFSGESIAASYSTCSAKGTTTAGIAGGLIGSASAGSITGCYSTGLVDGTAKYAFVGGTAGSLSGNYFYSIVNEVSTTDSLGRSVVVMVPPVNGYNVENAGYLAQVKPIDYDLTTYNTFVGLKADWKFAQAYDGDLKTVFEGRYGFETVAQLVDSAPTGYSNWNQLFVSMHYGDWPVPEELVVN